MEVIFVPNEDNVVKVDFRDSEYCPDCFNKNRTKTRLPNIKGGKTHCRICGWRPEIIIINPTDDDLLSVICGPARDWETVKKEFIEKVSKRKDGNRKNDDDFDDAS